ncbi:glycosyltransferase [Nocardioides sp. zg-1228]|uniref:glycosyltransferase family protein n=1 Tax=Nocardioides sp. zg-1228 TaxID=2763008 RepID=UPI001642C9E1|nr:glycosyltransferase [Nocardioides sp. zg-1228]MBC2933362.1 glycosyltransferase [Nocardioides sp. zg-1228]QSF56481.1 glycosyltransferase [Nocardioides sp. zg-1228]
MRGDRRRHQVRLDDAADVMVDSGLVDVDYVAAQLGTTFDSPAEAARAVVEAGDVSPHPLFEAQWIGRRRSWQRAGQHPVLWYVSERRRRNRIAPHPLVDPRIVFAAYPEARHHPYGALSYWLSVSGPATPLPTRTLPRKVSWSTYRAAAIAAAAQWRDEVVRERPPLVGPTPELPALTGASPAVTVVMAAQDDGPLVRRTVASLQAQSFTDWHLVAVDRGSLDDTAAVLQGVAAFDDRITLVRESRCSRARALNVALEHGTAEHVAFLPLGREWLPDMLRDLLAHAHASGAAAVLAGAGAVGRSRHELLAGRPVDLATALLRRDAVKDVGGFDEGLGGAVERDLVLRLTRDHEPLAVDVPVLRRPEAPPAGFADDWDSAVLERQLVDWEEAAARETDEALVSHVMPVGPEPRRTVEWLGSVPREGSELVLVGVRLRRAHHVLAASIAAVIAGARFVSVPANVSMSVATNVGISQAAGSTVVLVRPEAMPPRRPIAERLAGVLREPGVGLAQPLVVDLDGVILSAGARFAPDNPHPELFLAGLPTSDALRIGTTTVAAPAAPLVALRTASAVALGGLGARFRTVLAETDLGLRVARAGLGRTVLVPDAVITSRTAYADTEELIGALSSLRSTVLEVPPPSPDDSHEQLRTAGLEATDERNRRITADPDDPAAPAVLVPELVVRAVEGIRESPPRLRWAVDIAAPAAQRGDRWGDTYFARSLADALERRGQHVAIDRRDARHRDSRDHDDVLLVLRGLDRVTPRPGLLNVEWIISHPDMITPDEVAGFDLVYAASTSWSERVSREWGTPVTPLLQCTDTRWFHPDRAQPDTGPALLFVGNSRGIYRYAVRSALAIGADLTLHGNDWTDFVERDQIASGGIDNREVGVLYASAGIVLNDHHLDMRRDSFASNRLFDAAACGARILSDRIDGLEEIFSGLVLPFDNEHELARLVQPPYDAFPDDATRREIAMRIIAEHSFDKRAETLIDDAVRTLLARRR